MKQSSKTILLICLVLGSLLYSFADRGLRKKSRNHVILNINTSNSFKNTLSLNLKNGLKYTGFMLTENKLQTCFISSNYISTYQKGNTIYLVPSKQKIIVPETKQGYTGMKLILKSKD